MLFRSMQTKFLLTIFAVLLSLKRSNTILSEAVENSAYSDTPERKPIIEKDMYNDFSDTQQTVKTDKIQSSLKPNAGNHQVPKFSETKEDVKSSPKTQVQSRKPNIKKGTYGYFSDRIILRETVMGQMCASSYEFEGQIYDDCFLGANGKEYCKTDVGMVRECEPLPPPPAPEPEPETEISPKIEPKPESGIIQYTVTGKLCVFPNMYQGKVYNECIETEETGKKACYVDGQWEECRSNNIHRFLTDGRRCEFPFMYNQVEQYDCVKMPDENDYCKIDGAWQQCVSLIEQKSPDAFSKMKNLQEEDFISGPNTIQSTSNINSQTSENNSTAIIAISVLLGILVVAVVSAVFYFLKTRKNNGDIDEE